MGIEIIDISKQFGHTLVLDHVSFKVKTGKMVALLGPSGSGKTTLLRIIAGLEFADAGIILIDGVSFQNKPIQERKVGFVFQHYALFKHMTVFDNVAFGLNVQSKKKRLSPTQIKQKVMELLSLVHLDQFANYYPHQLSGGQKQRVALVRALAIEPKVLLLDEPFGALDAVVRRELRRWLRKLHDELQITSVFVTHDQQEALEVADHIVVMGSGKILQEGTPDQVWHTPTNSFVYNFLGSHNEFDGWQDQNGNIHLVESDITVSKGVNPDDISTFLNQYPIINHYVKRIIPEQIAELPFSEQIIVDKLPLIPKSGKVLKLFVRPYDMRITKTPENEEYVTAKVIYINSTGSHIKLELERKNGKLVQVEISKNLFDELNIKKGEILFVRPTQLNAYYVT